MKDTKLYKWVVNRGLTYLAFAFAMIAVVLYAYAVALANAL